MLGRTANDLFWLSRYVERAENMARLLEAGYRLAMTPQAGDAAGEEWSSTLASAGCLDRYQSKYDEFKTSQVVNFLLFDADNASSIYASLATARRNARAQRTALTREMWESLNSSWLEFQIIKPQNLRSDALPRILSWVKERSAAYRGALMNTILRNDTYFFSQLGTFVERADNTSRILDVKYYVLLPSSTMVGTSVDNVQWEAILRSVSAHRSYRWVYKDSYRSWRIADYLILNPTMPRSLRSCYREINATLSDLSTFYDEVPQELSTPQETLELLEETSIDDIFQSGLHEFLLDFIARNARVSQEISTSYHFNA